MEPVCDLNYYSYIVLINIAKTKVDFTVILPANRYEFSEVIDDMFSKEAYIIYNKENQVLSWGDPNFEFKENEHIKIDITSDRLLLALENIKQGGNEDIFIQAASDYMRQAVDTFEPDLTKQFTDGNRNGLRYLFVVPDEWEKDIKDFLIRPILSAAGLIHETDPQERLIIISDIEAIIYSFQNPEEYDTDIFKRGQNTIMCRLSPIDSNATLVKLNLISTMNNLFDIPNSMLFPKVMHLNVFTMTSENIKNDIEIYLKLTLGSFIDDQLLKTIAQDIYCTQLPDMSNEITMPWFNEKPEWELEDSQIDLLRKINPFNILSKVSKSLLDYMKDVITSNLAKKYQFLQVDDGYTSEIELDPYFIRWIESMLEHSRRFLHSVTKMNVDKKSFKSPDIIQGGCFYILESCHNADVHSNPRILPTEPSTFSPSIFLNSRPDAIINIDISLKSTQLSFSFLNCDGLVEEILDHNYFTVDNSIPSLDHFYDISNGITLFVKDQFIPFAEKYLIGKFSMYKYFSTKKSIQAKIEAILLNSEPKIAKRRSRIKTHIKSYNSFIKESILGKILFTKGELISIQQPKYTEAFLLMYMTYLKQIISSRLSTHSKHSHHLKLAYSVSMERNLMDNIIGSKEALRDIIYASDLVKKNDASKKLRITTHGEEYFPVIQQTFKLDFFLKSYFVLAQLHEDYIQLSLNQVVTESTDKEEQESIIIEDKIVPIQNIYESLCLVMWNKIVKHHSFIDSCDIHDKRDENKIIGLFSLNTKNEFTSYFKQYIWDNIFSPDSNTNSTETVSVRMSDSCNCNICLTVLDVINISFKPVIQDIASNISASLRNNNIFGNYSNIQYLFSIIYFNDNHLFQDTLTRILKEEIEDCSEEKDLELAFFFLEQLPHILLQPVLFHRPFSYQAFQIGTLHQVFSKNYMFGLYLESENEDEEENENEDEYDNIIENQFKFKNKRTDTKNVKLDDNTLFLLGKKGDIITHLGTTKQFYLNLRLPLDKRIKLVHGKAESPNILKHDQAMLFDDVNFKAVGNQEVSLGGNKFEVGHDIPVITSVALNNYSYSLYFYARMNGGENKKTLNVGEPMTLRRF